MKYQSIRLILIFAFSHFLIFAFSQKVGIGTTSPAGKLHVKGSANISQLIVDAHSTQGNANPLIKLRNSSGTDLMWIHSDHISNTFIGLNTGRVNNAAVGGQYNTFIGRDAGYSNTSGARNVVIGNSSLYSNTTGTGNVAIGIKALYSGATRNNIVAIGDSALYHNGLNAIESYHAWKNTAVGSKALFSNTVGAENTVIGSEALYANSTGNGNTAIGINTIHSNTTGSYNAANGAYALFSNTTGYGSTAIGAFVLASNTTGYLNTANGMSALESNTTGHSNTAYGYYALKSNTTGFLNTATGSYALQSNTTGFSNVAIGNSALYSNTTRNNLVAVGDSALYNNGLNTVIPYQATKNTAVGSKALFSNTLGDQNTAIGYNALKSNTGAFYNTAIGSDALYYSTGTNNTAIGRNAGNDNGTSPHNFTAIGSNAGHVASNSNEIEIGNSSVSWIAGEVMWSTYSDKRIKDNIQNNIPGLTFINKLNPVTYNLNIHRQNEICGIADTVQWEGKYDIEKIIQTGFVAQEVAQAARESNYDFSGVRAPTGNAKLYSIQYAAFVVPLVKAVQELSVENAQLKSAITTVTLENAGLIQRIEKLESLLGVER